MNPMQTFDPDVACRVHEGLNDKAHDWQPEWADSYRQYASEHDTGVIGWDGRLVDGWGPPCSHARKPIEIPPAAARAFVKDRRIWVEFKSRPRAAFLLLKQTFATSVHDRFCCKSRLHGSGR
jgi:hypothetical protein